MTIFDALNAAYGRDASGLRDRVNYLMAKAAVAVASESPATTNHTARLALSQSILAQAQSQSQTLVNSYALAVMVDTGLLAAASPQAISDATLETAVNSVFDAMTVPVAPGAVAQMTPAVVTGTLTRPANVTTYTAGDELTDTGGLVLAIAGCARAGAGAGILDSVTVIDNANAATDPSLDVFVMDATSTPAADNAVFAPTDAAMQAVIFTASLGVGMAGDAATTGNLVWQMRGLATPFVCGAGSTSLFVRFAVRNAYVPLASEAFIVRLGVRQA